MRTIILITAIALLSAVFYFQGSESGRHQVQAEPSTAPQMAEEESVKAALEKISAPTEQKTVAPAQKSSITTVATSPRKLRRKSKPTPVTSLEPAPRLTPAARDKKQVAAQPKNLDPKRQPKADRNFSNPMQDRWIDRLSGSDVGLSMGKSSRDSSCTDYRGGCREPRRDNELSLVGVVLKTENIVAQPTRPLDGEVKTGRYDEYLPAVYVE